MARTATIKRTTAETDITLCIDLDGKGNSKLETGVPFLTHMLTLFAKHGFFNLEVNAKGDTDVDDHHTTEDIGICLGQAFRQALGDKAGIRRYGEATVPMDDALAQVVVDLSDRPHFVLKADWEAQKVGTFDTELVHEFLWKFALEARINLHVIVPYGHNTHHIIEAIFKAMARALDHASSLDPRIEGILSTKGSL
ncbi:imidazoleglycerol-phosphate dehydratase HisB [Pullulanibacillus sp. KACC 23026]|uniref:imidazoleglycerol-phosphate dehydratase HisB n=1 Tax=Pullulanibacillus sp. KACC 23026 TaxID=3028315 RepID=UPI0023B14A8A|nr:imidazoleglycerol-phosphate dehydratase HisB [Pullulanibacillus sp. KACC 23026]WEG13617.1 imidazoleglycerol-phosphate dehydratase HisB [Pullulanibacillus sp. KACC 23026]